ncbi:UDP-galactose transporter Gms1 [Oleoguttula sp. CCFEE 5521]
MSRRGMSAGYRNGLLAAYALQSSALVLLIWYSRTRPSTNGARYNIATVIFLSEALKLVISLTMALFELITHPKTRREEGITVVGIFNEMARSVFAEGSWRMAIPASLYCLQNILTFAAVENIDVPTFLSASQLKIALLAGLGWLFLDRKLDMRQGLSVAVLCLGSTMVLLPLLFEDHRTMTISDLRGSPAFHSTRSLWHLKAFSSKSVRQLTKRSATYAGIDEDYRAQHPEAVAQVGLMALAFTCVMSTLAGAYMDILAEQTKSGVTGTSLWIRNVQLAVYSLLPAGMLSLIVKDRGSAAGNDFLAGYDWVVWLLVLLSATTGITTGAVMTYTDVRARHWATGLAILLALVASVVCFDVEPSAAYFFGTVIILGAMYLHIVPETASISRSRPPPISVSQYEKSGSSYFDLEPGPTPAQSPLHSGATSTSRPATPAVERRSLYMKSSSTVRPK